MIQRVEEIAEKEKQPLLKGGCPIFEWNPSEEILDLDEDKTNETIIEPDVRDSNIEHYVSSTDDIEDELTTETVEHDDNIENQERRHDNSDSDTEEHDDNIENQERRHYDSDSDESTYDYEMERGRDEDEMDEIINNFENEMNEIANNPEVNEGRHIIENENIVTETELNEDTSSEYDSNSEANNFDKIRSKNSVLYENVTDEEKDGTVELHADDIEMFTDNEVTGNEIRSDTDDNNEDTVNEDDVSNDALNSVNVGGRSLRANRMYDYTGTYDIKNRAMIFLISGDGTN